jgi:hypothetical protein
MPYIPGGAGGRAPVRPPSTTGSSSSSGRPSGSSLVQSNTNRVDASQQNQAIEAATKPYMTQSYAGGNVETVQYIDEDGNPYNVLQARQTAGIIPMPNMGWRYSAADAYSQKNPADPGSFMWNWGVESIEEAVAMYEDPAIVSPYLATVMDLYAKSIHPMKNGSTVWEEAVRASKSASMRGEYITPKDIVMGWLDEWKKDGGDTGSSGGGGYGGGGFGGGGGGGPQVNLMNEEDARAVVNNLANQMLGRTVSDKEFKMYYQNLLQLQRENPQTVEFTDDGGTEVMSPIGSDGLRYNLEEQMRNTEDFVTNTVGQQGMAMMEQYIASRRLG